MSSLPGNLVLWDDGALPALADAMPALTSVGGTLMVYGKLGVEAGGAPSLQPHLRNIKVGGGKGQHCLD